ncbi:MAG: transposase [Betaproteobacteria bacterium]
MVKSYRRDQPWKSLKHASRRRPSRSTSAPPLDQGADARELARDLWTPGRDAVQAVLPDARIFIDKFHAVRMATDAVGKVRKSLREQLTPKQRRGLTHDRFVLLKRERDLNEKEVLLLDGWTKSRPELGAAYRLKERFYGI